MTPSPRRPPVQWWNLSRGKQSDRTYMWVVKDASVSLSALTRGPASYILDGSWQKSSWRETEDLVCSCQTVRGKPEEKNYLHEIFRLDAEIPQKFHLRFMGSRAVPTLALWENMSAVYKLNVSVCHEWVTSTLLMELDVWGLQLNSELHWVLLRNNWISRRNKYL